jgi:hypothetical protein
LDGPTDSIDDAIHRGQQAWMRLRADNHWTDWLDVGRAHVIGRQEAMRLAHVNEPSGHRYKEHFGAWLKKVGFADLDKSDRARLFTVMDNLPAIERWRAALGATERMKLNHPSTVLRKWQVATRVPVKDDEAERKPSKLAQTESSLAVALEENAKLKREIERGGGDCWTEHDTPEAIAVVMAAKLSAAKFDRLIEAMKKLALRRLNQPPPKKRAGR